MYRRWHVIGLIAWLLIPTWALAACQGFGAQTLGGEGKPIIHVTNLNDAGTGSLRSALSGGNRMIVFDVAGTINLTSEITIRSAFLTIDGMSAPLPGITLQGKGLYIRGPAGHDVIVRGLRIRNSSTDGIWITDAAYNIMLEHVSIHNSVDGNLDITRIPTRDISICHSLFAEPAGEEKNLLLAFGSSRMTFHHNLFIAAQQRNPQVNFNDGGALDSQTTMDMRQNLIWNWRGGYGTRIRAGARVNVVNNYYNAAGGDRDDALLICKASGAPAECNNPTTNNARAFVQGNVNVGGPDINGRGTESAPFAAPLMSMQTAQQAACDVFHEAGAHPRDAIDQHYLAMVTLPACDAPPPPPDRDTCPWANLARCAVASASSVWSSSYTAAQANDGQGTTRWNSAASETSGAWLALDLGDLQTFDTFVVKEAISRITSYRLQYWDGTTWVDIVIGSSIGASKTHTFAALTAQRVRLLVTRTISQSSTGTPTIAEFEVY